MAVEPWLRGPIDGVPPLLQPAAHAFQMALEDIATATQDLTREEWFARPGGTASVAFHVLHLSGSTDRLLAYARGDALTEAQRDALREEASVSSGTHDPVTLHANWRAAVQRALTQLAATDPGILLEPRRVGRAGLPSTVLGLLFHAAEHASRHTGQVVTTAKVVLAMRRV